jgi:hypothetical protein
VRRSEAEEIVKMWALGEGKIFKYPRPLLPDEYVVLKKEHYNLYKFSPKDSTYQLKDFDRDTLILALVNEELVYIKDHTYRTNTKTLKTGGCDCGAWILRDSKYLHDEKCPCYKDKNKQD